VPAKEWVQDDVICLKRREFSETSQVLVFLSRIHGKVAVLAKGSKRPRGKTAGGIDLLDTGQAGFITNIEGLGLLREFVPGKPWQGIRNNIRKWYAALYLAEVVNLSTKDLQPVTDVYDLLLQAIEQVTQSTSNLQLADILVTTMIHLLTALGYQPELRQCINCKRQMTPSDWLFFSATGGGLVCRDCEPGVYEKIRLEHRAWYYLIGKVHDLISASKAFEIVNYMLREHLERVPTMTSYCQVIFTPENHKEPPKPQNHEKTQID